MQGQKSHQIFMFTEFWLGSIWKGLYQGGSYWVSELVTVQGSGREIAPKNGQFPISLSYFMTTDLLGLPSQSYSEHCYG